MSIPYIVHYFRPLYDDMILLEGAMGYVHSLYSALL
jgi:hypothetical protein